MKIRFDGWSTYRKEECSESVLFYITPWISVYLGRINDYKEMCISFSWFIWYGEITISNEH